MEKFTPDLVRQSLDARTTFFDENRRGERPIDAEYVRAVCDTFLDLPTGRNSRIGHNDSSEEPTPHARELLERVDNLNGGLTSVMVDGPLFETMEHEILADLESNQ